VVLTRPLMPETIVLIAQDNVLLVHSLEPYSPVTPVIREPLDLPLLVVLVLVLPPTHVLLPPVFSSNPPLLTSRMV